MAITEAPEAVTATRTAAVRTSGTTAVMTKSTGEYKPVPVWFFAFEGLIGASYDVVKSYPDAWMFLAAAVVVNIVLARTVLRGRLKMAKAILKGRRTRKIAVGLIALRLGVHLALGAVGAQATSAPAHIAFAVVMCGATVGLLAFDQRVMLRALAAA
jgi:hypothetical protein